MSELSFLTHFPDPFDVKRSRYCRLLGSGEVLFPSANDLAATEGRIVTYDTSALLDDLRRAGAPPPSGLIEIADALRLKVGIAKNEGGEKLWNTWKNLAPYFPSSADADLFKKLVQSRISRPSIEETDRLLRDGAIALHGCWRELFDALREGSELRRFVAVELPTRQIFLWREHAGIRVSRFRASELLAEVTQEKFRAFIFLADVLGRSPSGLNFWNVREVLEKTDVAELAAEEDGGRLRDLFKMAAHHSSFARSFLTYVDAERDESTLKRAFGATDRLFPSFQTVGTVTGRVLVADPHLQQLRRRYRKVILADEGKSLVYLDYRQFEPGVLAYLSQDSALIEAYNSKDLYISLSEAMYGSDEHRALCKRIFLAYSYGMTTSRIGMLILGASAEEVLVRDFVVKVDGFFENFSGLVQFRLRSQEELVGKSYSSSVFGNRRWRTSNGQLSPLEKRWALNHPVQATASLIFKTALISLAHRFGRDSILLPMHDAVLMQFDEGNARAAIDEAKRMMEQAFEQLCPGVSPKIVESAFDV